MRRGVRAKAAHAVASLALVLAGCGGGDSSPGAGNGSGGSGGGGSGSGGTGALYTPPPQLALTQAEVGIAIARAVEQAQARGAPAVIAVVDRVGNVLGVFRMNGAPVLARIPDAPNVDNVDIQGLSVPAEAAAIAKAITGAYLSSGGNAFSSRTASMIVQEHFPPAPSTVGLESGPLFGVQFSQLPCSDLAARFGPEGMIGPKRSPLGLAADPGGFPLYKNGVLVGGIGVLADAVYGFDPNVLDVDRSVDEAIALAGTLGFESPVEIRANRITVDGTSLRFSDFSYSDLMATPGGDLGSVAGLGGLVAVRGYADAVLRAGTAYGSGLSGIRAATAAEFANRDAFVLADGAGTNRFPVRAGTDGNLTQAEARTILEEAFAVMSRARAQIRQPLDSRAEVSISLVDTNGQVLGIVRSPDAPIFGIDVSLQKARTANFFSGPFAAAQLTGTGGEVAEFVQRVRAFLNDPTALTGAFAFADRSGGNLSRPYFPDGEVGTPHGPLSRSIEQFNPFSTGLQSALVLENLAQHLAFVTAASNTDTPRGCTGLPELSPGRNRLQNGIQIFPGSVPVYRNGQLVGGLGVSGDGIDQDDMISFLGTHNAGLKVGINNAPVEIRADRIVVDVAGRQVRLRYISCPFAPFLDDPAQNVCEGK